jgi:hypothetical protein
VTQLLASATQGRTYHRARAALAEQLHQKLLGETVAKQRAALLDQMEEGIEDLLAQFDRRTKKGSGRGQAASGSDVDGLMRAGSVRGTLDRRGTHHLLSHSA